MLPTEERTDVLVNTYKKDELVALDEKEYEENIGKLKERGFEYQHLYFTSDEEIKEEDWYIDDKNVIRQSITSDKDHWKTRPDYKKIIATTDRSLLKPYTEQTLNDVAILPQPSKAFIKKYCELGGIDEVMIEYIKYAEALNGKSLTPHNIYKLKINSHNKITIHPVKDSWSEEEVKELCRSAWSSGYNTGYYDSEDTPSGGTAEDWINENL